LKNKLEKKSLTAN